MSAYSDRVIADGASYYWRLGEPSGTTAVDIVGGANGTISGGVTLGQPGGVPGDTAMAFDGTGAIAVASLTLPVPCTVEGWLKPSLFPDHQAMVSTRGPTNGFLVGCDSSRRVECYSDNSTPVNVVTAAVLTAGVWAHIVMTRTSTTTILYVNGVATSLAQTHGVVSSTVRISDPANGNPVWGSIDEVAIYPRALAPSEVAAHYAAAAASTGGVRTLSFGWWKQGDAA